MKKINLFKKDPEKIGPILMRHLEDPNENIGFIPPMSAFAFECTCTQNDSRSRLPSKDIDFNKSF